jgi:hypothetical protein
MTDKEKAAIVERVAKALFVSGKVPHLSRCFDAAAEALETAGFFGLLEAAEEAVELDAFAIGVPGDRLRRAIRRAKEDE